MDKFLDKTRNTNNGLDNIGNLQINQERIDNDKRYFEVLSNFKHKLLKHINKFDPGKNKSNNYIDNSLNTLWFQYLLQAKNPKEYSSIYKELNIKYEEDSFQS